VPGGVKRSLFVDTTREENARDVRLNHGYMIDSVRHAVPFIRRAGRDGGSSTSRRSRPIEREEKLKLTGSAKVKLSGLREVAANRLEEDER
jgi:hypothetical protein